MIVSDMLQASCLLVLNPPLPLLPMVLSMPIAVGTRHITKILVKSEKLSQGQGGQPSGAQSPRLFREHLGPRLQPLWGWLPQQNNVVPLASKMLIPLTASDAMASMLFDSPCFKKGQHWLHVLELGWLTRLPHSKCCLELASIND